MAIADIPHLSFKNCSFFNSLRINGLQTRMISANFRQRLLMRLDFSKEPQLLSFLVINRTKLFESVRHFWLLGDCPRKPQFSSRSCRCVHAR